MLRMTEKKNLKIAILGFGREGRAVLKYIRNNKTYKNAEIFILDQNQSQSSEVAYPKFYKMNSGPDYLKNLKSFDLVFRSPGVPYNLPEIQKAIGAGVRFTSATKLFFEKAPCKIIGVTGTKGKGTTSTLIYKILKASGADAHLLGNIGKPAIEALPKLKKKSIVIFELSSFQLQDLETSPDVAVVLNIFPDHMDSHSNFEEYVHAKASIARYQKNNQHIFYFEDNKHSKSIGAQSDGIKHGISTSDFKIFKAEDLKIPGAHNFKNAVMAANVALHLKIPKSIILKTVKNYKGLEHRLEFARSIKVGGGKISFYNDSGGTNPHTAAAAVLAFKEPMILIAGGKDKNLDYAPLARALRDSKNCKTVILFGENKDKIKTALGRIMNKEFRIMEEATLESAVREAYKIIRSYIIHDSRFIILFSPGAASFDMFKDYADRGEKFKQIVGKMK